MKISRSTECMNTTEALYKLWSDAGFEALDMNEFACRSKNEDDYKMYIKERIGWTEKYGMTVGQCHGVSAETYDGLSTEKINDRIALIASSIKLASELRVPYTIIHPFIYSWSNDDTDRARTTELNMRYLKEVTRYAENTTVCLENLPGIRGHVINGAQMKEYTDSIKGLCVCLDTGHMFSNGVTTEDFFSAVGEKIKVMHIHDTMPGVDKHMLAFTGIGNWKEFAETVKKYGYSGDFNSESAFAMRTPIKDRLLLERVEAEAMRALSKM